MYSYITFQHLPRRVFERYLGEIHRVLTPDGYLAFQLPIGLFQDFPLEDIIGIRSYSIQEIEAILSRNELGFLPHTASDHEVTNISDPLSHRFHLARRTGPPSPMVSPDWVELERPHFLSKLDCHLYAIYADDCTQTGKYQEGIKTLQNLVKKNPDFIAEWLQLATLLIETGQSQQALGTLKKLTTLHPSYREGLKTFQNLQMKHASQESAFFTPLLTYNQASKNEHPKATSEHTTKNFSLR